MSLLEDGQSVRHVIIIGFGLPGRATVNTVIDHGLSYCVIDQNPATAVRCVKGGLKIITGDARDPEILRQAEIERATEVAIAIPDDQAVEQIILQVRRLNPNAHIIARCTFVSDGFEATKHGANDVVVGEKVIAAEFERLVNAQLLGSAEVAKTETAASRHGGPEPDR